MYTALLSTGIFDSTPIVHVPSFYNLDIIVGGIESVGLAGASLTPTSSVCGSLGGTSTAGEQLKNP